MPATAPKKSATPAPKGKPSKRRGDYEAKRAAQAEVSREQSEQGRDIGPLPKVVNPRRKAKAKRSLRVFAETYFAEQFALAWSADHLKALALMQDCILSGGLFALAMPRGSGKTTLAEVAALWAALFGYRRYVVVVGATEPAAEEMIESFMATFETNDLLAEDFPEVCHPVRALERISHRTRGQTLDGTPTRIGWKSKQIILPTVPGSAASGCVLRVAGIEGRIRGMKHKLADGRTIRPDLALLDDPQTDASARSPKETTDREGVVQKAVLGLAGPRVKIAAFMLCTVVAKDDLSERFLNPKTRPEWQGIRTKMLNAEPTNRDLWEQYAQKRADSFRAGTKGLDATEFYLANRAAMDAGAEVSWPERYEPGEVSGLQHAMNLRLRDEAAFLSEYQNDPPDPLAAVQAENLKPEAVAGKLTRLARGVVPRDCSRLTAFVDVQKRILFYAVCAWDERYGGAVVDYGTYPPQPDAYFSADNPAAPLERDPALAGCPDTASRIYAGLGRLSERLLGRAWPREDEGGARVNLCLVDANWGESKAAVYDYCRRSPFAAVLLPSHGKYVGPNDTPMEYWSVKAGSGVQNGGTWRITPAGGRHVTYDTNAWKSFVAARFRTPPGAAGCLSVFGAEPFAHRLFADHCTAEFVTTKVGLSRTIEEWKLRPSRSENHWWDGLVGCAVGASICGLKYSPAAAAGEPPLPPKRRVKLSELSGRHHG